MLKVDEMAKVVKAVFVSHFVPSAVGNGGNHRAYQILHDLEQIVGAENVLLVSWPEWSRLMADQLAQEARSSARRPLAIARRVGRKIPPLRWAVRLGRRVGRKIPPLQWVVRLGRHLRQRLPLLAVDHPVDLFIGRGQTAKQFSSAGFLTYYREQVARLASAAVCLIEHPGFSDILPINRQLDIPTIACPQNIEAFDTMTCLYPDRLRQLHLAALGFADEFQALAQCDARLFISKIETALFGGLGAPSHYYPYLPVGEIRRALESVRARRNQGDIEPGLFLLIGTADHTTTGQAFRWFLQQATAFGLPKGSKIVVCGAGTSSLLPDGASVPGVEVRGWVEQSELEALLSRAQGILIPHTVGFGAITRVPEMSLAGIPIIMSQHPAYAIDLPPGVITVEDDWQAWTDAMCNLMQGNQAADLDAYQMWEKCQVNTLHQVVRRLLPTSDSRNLSAVTDEKTLCAVQP